MKKNQKGKYGGNALGNQGCKSGTEHAQTKPGNHPKVHKNIQDRRKKSRSAKGILDSPMEVNMVERMLYINKNGKPAK